MEEQKAEYYDKFYSEVGEKKYLDAYDKLTELLPKNKNARILDAGCGAGEFLKLCWDKGYKNICGIDFSAKALEKANDLLLNVPLYHENVANPIGQLGLFDCIVMIQVLEHIEDDIGVLRNLMRSLKPNGFLLGTVPNRQMSPEITKGHVRTYDERTFMERFDLPGRIIHRSDIMKETVINFIWFKFWKNPPEPKMSFVVPTYMGDAYLSQTLDSLVNQTVEEIEIIVVNDGYEIEIQHFGFSPTEVLMDWWLKNDGRIRYFAYKKHKGVVSARNFGNRQARAEIIGVSDQDDLSKERRAEISLKTFKAHPEINCLYSSYNECDVDGEPLAFYDAEPMNRDIFINRKWKTWFHSSAAYRKKDILTLPYKKKPGCTDDWVFLDTWTKAGMIFYPIKEVLADCRRLPMGVMAERRRQTGFGPNYTL